MTYWHTDIHTDEHQQDFSSPDRKLNFISKYLRTVMVAVEPNNFYRMRGLEEGATKLLNSSHERALVFPLFLFFMDQSIVRAVLKSPPSPSHLRSWGGGISQTPNQWEYPASSSWVWTGQLTARDLNQTVTPWILPVWGERRFGWLNTNCNKCLLTIVYMELTSGVTHCRLMNRLQRQQTVSCRLRASFQD